MRLILDSCRPTVKKHKQAWLWNIPFGFLNHCAISDLTKFKGDNFFRPIELFQAKQVSKRPSYKHKAPFHITKIK